MRLQGVAMVWHPVSFGYAQLLVAGFPVSPLAVSAAVQHEATPGASRKLGGILTSFECGTVTANSAIGHGQLLVFSRG
jgi:hypothetical protein